ncbi:hypothetical protein ACFP3I_00610 [Chryseobacterium arachidis]|uniref:hypothetical protein n=1 Tax=Chryseobacterium arachidis TaxID=1416778 RepID=UPI003610535A
MDRRKVKNIRFILFPADCTDFTDKDFDFFITTDTRNLNNLPVNSKCIRILGLI